MRIMDYGAIKQVGVVLVLKEGITKEEARALINRVLAQELDHDAPVQVGEFDPRYGQPVFYVP